MRLSNLKDFLGATRGAKKVVVVDLGFLGDTVHLLPSLWEIKGHYPDAELHVLTSPVGKEVLSMAPCVDKAWSFPLGPPSPSWWEHLDVLRAMRRERYDVSFNFSGADRTVFACAFLGARHRIAYRGARKHFWQPWLIQNWIERRALPTPIFEGRRQILALCGFDLKPARFDLKLPDGDCQWAEQNIPAGAVHLSLSASTPLKEWPLRNNIQLIQFLLKEMPDLQVLVTAAPNSREQARLQQVRKDIDNARLLFINEPLTITRLSALLQRCAMHIGPDSGVIHLAAALNVPTVAIFRRYHDMADWLPQGARHTCFDAPCACMGVKDAACSQSGEAACLAGITAEVVGKEVCRRLASSAAKAAS